MFDALSEYDRIKDPQGSKYDEARARTCFRLSMGTVVALFVAYLVFNYVVINGERLAEESGALPSSVTGDAVDVALPQTADAEGAAAAAAPALPADVAMDGAQTSNAVEQLLSDAQEHAVVDEVAPGTAQHEAAAANIVEQAAREDATAGAEVAVGQAEVAADEDAAVRQDTEEQQVPAVEEGGAAAAQQDEAATVEETAQADVAEAEEAPAAAEEKEEEEEEAEEDEEASPLDSLLGSSDMHGVQWWLGAGFGFLGLATLVLLCANTAPPSAAIKQRLLDDERHSYTVLV